MNRNDYLSLQERYFEARTTPKQTRALKAYVTQNDDPAFDDVRAVMSYMSTGRLIHGKQLGTKRSFRPALVLAAAASLAVVLFLLVRPDNRRNGIIQPAGQPSDEIRAMEQELTLMFSHQLTDIESQLSKVFTP